MIVQYLVKLLLLFSLIFILQNYSTAQITPPLSQLAPLAKFWNVSENVVPKLLAIEKNLTIANEILTQLLSQYNESFGGSYIDAKENLVFINTMDFSKESIIRSSSKLKEFENLLKFIPANHSTYQLESSFNNLNELADKTNPVNIMFGISPIYNAIVVDLSHTDDIANEAFINGTLSFGPIILMNYLEYDDSLMLNSTIDLPTSRPRTKRYLDIRYLGGEGVAFLNHENQVELRCSAGVFAFSETTGDRFILTSGRCFPEDLKDLNTTFIYHVPWGQPEAFNFFGFSNFTSYSTTDFTIIERFDNEIDLTPQIRSSDNNFPSLFIEKFGNPIVGQHMCISGYVINIVCGRVTSLAVNPFLSALRIHTITVRYLGLLRIETSGVTLHDIDRGGTVFSYIPSIGNQRVEVYGYVTHYYGRSRKSRKETVAVTTIHNLRTFGRFMNDLTFIDMGTYQPPL